MLKELALITITVSNLAQVETAWQQHFDYQVADRGTVSTELAEYWDAEAAAGSDYVVMQPSNDAPVYIRFVEDAAVEDYKPMTSYGWNATELLVSDPDKLAAGMADSAFEIVGPPKDLWPAPDAPRAMQVAGPGRELVYLTKNNKAAAALQLDASMPLAERPFIMVLGGPSMTKMTEFYSGTLSLQADPPSAWKITMISKANNLDPDTVYPLAIVRTAPGYMIELDELPKTIGPRAVTEGHLPPGVAVVGFNSDGLDAQVEWISKPRTMDEFPYAGRKAGIFRGSAGELVEVILPNDGER
jgi:hypothetical protein